MDTTGDPCHLIEPKTTDLRMRNKATTSTTKFVKNEQEFTRAKELRMEDALDRYISSRLGFVLAWEKQKLSVHCRNHHHYLGSQGADHLVNGADTNALQH